MPKTAVVQPVNPAPVPIEPPKTNIDAQELWNRLDQIKNAPFQTLNRAESGCQSTEFQQQIMIPCDDDQSDRPEVEIVEIEDCDTSDSAMTPVYVKCIDTINSSSSDSYVLKD